MNPLSKVHRQLGKLGSWLGVQAHKESISQRSVRIALTCQLCRMSPGRKESST